MSDTKEHKVMLASYSQSLTFKINLSSAEVDLLYDIEAATRGKNMCLIIDPKKDEDPYD